MAANKKHFTLSVANQEGSLYYGDCDVVFVPGVGDTIAVMAYHTPMIARLTAGPISVRLDHKDTVVANAKSGIMYVGDNEVSILVN